MHIVSTSNNEDDLKHKLILYLNTLSPIHNKVMRSKSSAMSPCKKVKGDDLIVLMHLYSIGINYEINRRIDKITVLNDE